MFVADGARDILRSERRRSFAHDYVDPMVAEARHLGMTDDQLIELLRERAQRHE